MASSRSSRLTTFRERRSLPNCQPQVYVFPRDRIRFKGEALAGVAAETEAIAEAALKKIKLEVEILPHAFEVADAARDDAEPMYEHSPRVSEPKRFLAAISKRVSPKPTSSSRTTTPYRPANTRRWSRNRR